MTYKAPIAIEQIVEVPEFGSVPMVLIASLTAVMTLFLALSCSGIRYKMTDFRGGIY